MGMRGARALTAGSQLGSATKPVCVNAEERMDDKRALSYDCLSV